MKSKIDKTKKMLTFKLREVLNMTDLYTLCMLLIYTVFAIIFFSRIDGSDDLILINIAIGIGIVSIATVDSKLKGGRLFTIFRRIYILPLVFIIYSQVQYYITIVNPSMYDEVLIQWDRAIFGVDPTKWMYQFANPVLTEYLQFSYILFFIMPLALGVELHVKNKEKEFSEYARLILFSFYFSYLMYFFMPAVGPRFTLHEFGSLSVEMPGIWLTEFFRSIVNSGGNISLDMANPEQHANKDCMPSGHTWITLVTIYLAFRERSMFKIPILIFGLSLIFSTVYLRYHYVVDVTAGFVLALISIKIEPLIRNFFKEKLGFKDV